MQKIFKVENVKKIFVFETLISDVEFLTICIIYNVNQGTTVRFVLQKNDNSREDKREATGKTG